MRLLALVLVVGTLAAEEPLGPLEFLKGDWVGVAAEKDTPHGAGEGDFSFAAELGGKVMVRRNQASYQNGVRHEDLMVVYLEKTPRAIYFDSEGHVIRYLVTVPEAGRAVFESEAGVPGPRFRLTYVLAGGRLAGRFEVAPPGGEFKPYLSWTSRRK